MAKPFCVSNVYFGVIICLITCQVHHRTAAQDFRQTASSSETSSTTSSLWDLFLSRSSTQEQLEEPGEDLAFSEQNGDTVMMGGGDGWVMLTYEPVFVAVGDVLNFSYVEEDEARIGGHDVWLMPDKESYEGCDFTRARFLGRNGVLHRITEPGDFYFACQVMDGAHCYAGHKVEVVASRGRSLRARRQPSAEEYGADFIRKLKARSRNQHETWKRNQALKSRGVTLGRVFQPQQAAPLAWCSYSNAAKANVDWSSATQWAAFDMYGCTSVSGIHVQLMADKTVVVIDRTDTINTVLKDPVTKENFYGEELQFTTGDPTYPFKEVPLDVVTNLFCSTGQLMPDGRMVSIGGSTEANTNVQLLNGSFSIRSYKGPCTQKKCTFALEQNMTSRRWYPTAQIIGTGRVMIVGGSNTTGNVAINKPGVNNPTIEYHPRGPGEGNFFVQFLEDTMPYNLYAFVHLLPSGNVFIFAANAYILYNTVSNQVISGNYPRLNVTSDLYGAPVMRTYPMSGTSSMFPLDPFQGNNQAEIMICGGSSTLAVPVNGGSQRASIANVVWYADYMCYRIRPESANATWIPEPMCDTPACAVKYRRVMGDAVLLADGSLLIMNGAQQGFQGLTTPGGQFDGGYGRSPALQPVLYLTNNHTWYPVSRLPASKVPRMYHASALLMHDATVLVTGSNPNTQNNWPFGRFPTEFRLERFRPPYLMTGAARPVITSSPTAITVDTLFAVYFTATQTSSITNFRQRFSFTLAYPGFSTHNQRHGMRNVNLGVSQVMRVRGTTFVAVVRSPSTLNWAPPTQYWLWLLDSGIPAEQAKAINVTRSLRTRRSMMVKGQPVLY